MHPVRPDDGESRICLLAFAVEPRHRSVEVDEFGAGRRRQLAHGRRAVSEAVVHPGQVGRLQRRAVLVGTRRQRDDTLHPGLLQLFQERRHPRAVALLRRGADLDQCGILVAALAVGIAADVVHAEHDHGGRGLLRQDVAIEPSQGAAGHVAGDAAVEEGDGAPREARRVVIGDEAVPASVMGDAVADDRDHLAIGEWRRGLGGADDAGQRERAAEAQQGPHGAGTSCQLRTQSTSMVLRAGSRSDAMSGRPCQGKTSVSKKI